MSLMLKELADRCVTLTRESDQCGVYFLLIDEEVVYIGASVSAWSRVRCHKARPDRVLLLPVKDEIDRYAYEAALIRRFKPRMNGQAQLRYTGDDNELLRTVGVPEHANEAAAIAEWRLELSAARSVAMRRYHERHSTPSAPVLQSRRRALARQERARARAERARARLERLS